jgi:Zn-dependent protease/CBS domain-containing protein
MFGKRLRLFSLFGFQVNVDSSWLLLFLLITWSLATGAFPLELKGERQSVYWVMGAIGALGLFGSIVFHEMCHSLVARRYALRIRGITLFIFGGVAEMTEEPASPKVEFLMAAAGPLSSVVLGITAHVAAALGKSAGVPLPVDLVIAYLGSMNLALAAFNLLPAFPLDGGRVFRSILWAWKGDLRRATRLASRVGSGFGIAFMALGGLMAITGGLISGLWMFLIGMFLRNASRTSYQQVLLRRAMEGEPVNRFMERRPVVISPNATVSELVEDYIYRHHFKTYPVVEDGHLVGCVGVEQVKHVPRAEWGRHSVAEIATPCSRDNTIGPDADATQALAQMNRTGAAGLMVVDHDQLVGILSLRDLLGLLALKMELGEATA